MKFQAESKTLHLANLLRYLVRMRNSRVLDRGVFECVWECRSLFAEVVVYRDHQGPGEVSPVFPEFGDSRPFRVDGVRLLERIALVTEFEETEFVRLRDAECPNACDLLIYADTGLLRAETDDERLHETIKAYFDRTSDSIFKSFFF